MPKKADFSELVAESNRLTNHTSDAKRLKRILLKPAEETADKDVEWVIEKAYRVGSLNSVNPEQSPIPLADSTDSRGLKPNSLLGRNISNF